MPRRADFIRIRVALAHSAHFSGLTPRALDRLADLAQLRHATHDERLPADNPDLWIVVDGAVRLAARLPQGGREHVHAVLGRGSYFGLARALGHGSFPLDARAIGPTDLALVGGERLREALKLHPGLWRYVAGLAFGRLRLALGLIQDNRLRPLAERIIRRLLGHAASRLFSDDARLELRMTQSDLGRMVDAGRSRVNVAIKKLESDGLILQGYRTITLLDLPRLRELANGPVEAF